MERVVGIGGVFLRSPDPARLSAWYRDVLGLGTSEHGEWAQQAGPSVFAPVTLDSDVLAPDQRAMLNLRVDDLDAMLLQVRAAGAAVADETFASEETGRFAWVVDPDGNRVELWQPPDA